MLKRIVNLFNTPSFGNPNAAFGNAGFGSITTTANNIPRQMQFAVKLLFQGKVGRCGEEIRRTAIRCGTRRSAR